MQRLYKVPHELLIELIPEPPEYPGTYLVMVGSSRLGASEMEDGRERTHVYAADPINGDEDNAMDSIEGGTEELRIEWSLKRLLEMLNEQATARAIEQGLSLPRSAGFFERTVAPVDDGRDLTIARHFCPHGRRFGDTCLPCGAAT